MAHIAVASRTRLVAGPEIRLEIHRYDTTIPVALWAPIGIVTGVSVLLVVVVFVGHQLPGQVL